MTGPRRSERRGRRRLFAVLPATVVLAAVSVAGFGSGLVDSATASDEPADVLEPTKIADSTAPLQNPLIVSDKINKLANSKPMGKSNGTVVIDPGEQKTLYDDDSQAMLAPASSMKVPTAVAALTHVGVNTRIETKTVQPPGESDVYLVGGGDPLLSSGEFPKSPTDPKYPVLTSMKDLAKDTAKSLKASGNKKIKLRYDASLFTGPDWNPDWPGYFTSRGIVAPVQALKVDHGKVSKFGPRTKEPAKQAGDRFAKLLRGEGIKVASVTKGRSPASVETLAVVSSVPMYEIVGEMLTVSDNDTAEALFRLSALASGNAGSFEGGTRAVGEALRGLGISMQSTKIKDGSGLSDLNRISPRILAEIVSQAVLGEEDLWPITDGVPVAGVSGSLKRRFGDQRTENAVGRVRAKTGTLVGISSLTGYVHSKSGRVLVFASIANEAKSSGEAANVIDRIAARVASCGCAK